jgi:hypothetical protein
MQRRAVQLSLSQTGDCKSSSRNTSRAAAAAAGRAGGQRTVVYMAHGAVRCNLSSASSIQLRFHEAHQQHVVALKVTKAGWCNMNRPLQVQPTSWASGPQTCSCTYRATMYATCSMLLLSSACLNSPHPPRSPLPHSLNSSSSRPPPPHHHTHTRSTRYVPRRPTCSPVRDLFGSVSKQQLRPSC